MRPTEYASDPPGSPPTQRPQQPDPHGYRKATQNELLNVIQGVISRFGYSANRDNIIKELEKIRSECHGLQLRD